MKNFVTPAFLERLFWQKKMLIRKNPILKFFFIDIEFSDFCGGSLVLPFLPIRSFRDFHLRLGEKSETTTFFSSGTTHSQRASHTFSQERLRSYAKHACLGFSRFLARQGLDPKTPIVSLVPSPSLWPQSSLAAMIAMLKEGGFSVEFCDVENGIDALKHRLRELSSCPSLIVFGTSWHHVLVALANKTQDRLFAGQRLVLIDTGGTKGRTHSFSLSECQSLFYLGYGRPLGFSVCSEYGMCELASQGWSLSTQGHDGTFLCNETLRCASVDPLQNKALQPFESGFLAFFDSLNLGESWPTFVTEDLGCALDSEGNAFRLFGRAPDASLKGCSLNVKEHFLFAHHALVGQEKAEKTSLSLANTQSHAPRPSRCPDVASVVNTLPQDVWTASARDDLRQTLASWNLLRVMRPTHFLGKDVLVIAPANIPIAWIAPARTAALMGARSVCLKLPSLRGEGDVLSQRVRKRTITLIEHLRPFLAPTQIVVEQTLDLSLANFAKIVVFGTDATIDTFRNLLQDDVGRLVPQGDVRNSYPVSATTDPVSVASLCGLWLGRGCLSPACLFFARNMDKEKKRLWLETFSAAFFANMRRRYREDCFSPRFLHAHTLWLLRSFLTDLDITTSSARILGRDGVFVVDLSGFEATCIQKLIQSGCTPALGGGGLVFIVDEAHLQWFSDLSCVSVTPTLADPHGEKTWEEWLL